MRRVQDMTRRELEQLVDGVRYALFGQYATDKDGAEIEWLTLHKPWDDACDLLEWIADMLHCADITPSACELCGATDACDCKERIECDKGGTVGHLSCGVCPTCDKPRFNCSCATREVDHVCEHVSG